MSFVLQDGDSLKDTQWACGGCGKKISLPRFAPRPMREGHNYPPFLRGKNYVPAPPIPNSELKRFTKSELAQILSAPDEWPRSGDSWDNYEIEILLDTKPCGCGDHWQRPDYDSWPLGECVPHPLSRCPSCRSQCFVYQLSEVLSD